jgi:hypothetical protein
MLVKSAYSVVEMQSMIAKTPFVTGGIDVEGIGFLARLERRADERETRALS